MAGLQGRGNAGCAVVLLLGLLAFLHGVQAVTITVGGASTGWNYPPANNPAWYDSVWAANQTFHVGDVLLFTYAVGTHNVLTLGTQADYTACNIAAPKSTLTTGSDKVPLPTAGTYYFVCGFPTHCTSGMKVKVTVVAAAATPPPVAPVKAPTPPPVAPVTAPTPPPAVIPKNPSGAPAPASTGGSQPGSAPALQSATGLVVAAVALCLALLW